MSLVNVSSFLNGHDELYGRGSLVGEAYFKDENFGTLMKISNSQLMLKGLFYSLLN